MKTVATQRRRGGFTLIELLIALLLTTLIFGLLFGALRIAARGAETTERRQQQSGEQYQLQQLLRRLIGQARSERVRDGDGVLQVAFRGEREQLIFVAPRYAGNGGQGLLWYRLYLSPATAQRGTALVLQTRIYDGSGSVEWQTLFDPEVTQNGQGEDLPPPVEHLLRLTGEARLSFSYSQQEQGRELESSDEWLEQNQLPLLVELSLEEFASDGDKNRDDSGREQAALLPGWQALAVALQEYTQDVRSDRL